jgi:membrane-associated protease RseP (regulator of RpoE activity)
MRVEPDGVKVEVSEDVDGKKETKTYSAKTLEELYAAHPELRDQFGMHIEVGPGSSGLFGLRGRQDNPFGSPGAMVPDAPTRPAIPLERGAFRTDVLGVQVDTPSAEERRLAKVGDDVGLKVESVQPGTIAARIGVQAGDLVVDVNGHEVKSVEDVRDTLRARKDGEDVTVTVVDENGQRRVLTWRAGAEEKRSERRF